MPILGQAKRGRADIFASLCASNFAAFLTSYEEKVTGRSAQGISGVVSLMIESSTEWWCITEGSGPGYNPNEPPASKAWA